MPEARETAVPETPAFQAELEEQLRREARSPRRFSLLAFLTPDALRIQRLVLHGSMSVFVFVVAAAVALPMLQVGAGPASSPRAAWAEQPITADIIREPSHEPGEALLIDGRYEVDDFGPMVRYVEDDGRSYVR